VEQPHRCGQRRAVGLDGRQNNNGFGREELLDVDIWS
jgi:hypothetical protein